MILCKDSISVQYIPVSTHKRVLKGSIWSIDFEISSGGTRSISKTLIHRKIKTVIEIEPSNEKQSEMESQDIIHNPTSLSYPTNCICS